MRFIKWIDKAENDYSNKDESHMDKLLSNMLVSSVNSLTENKCVAISSQNKIKGETVKNIITKEFQKE